MDRSNLSQSKKNIPQWAKNVLILSIILLVLLIIYLVEDLIFTLFNIIFYFRLLAYIVRQSNISIFTVGNFRFTLPYLQNYCKDYYFPWCKFNCK